MSTQHIELGDDGWHIMIYYNAEYSDRYILRRILLRYECPEELVDDTIKVLKHKNTGFTFSNSDYKISIVCIGKTSSKSQFISTVVHEAKHVQSHICAFYGVSESGEEAAYLIGYIAKRMYKKFINYI